MHRVRGQLRYRARHAHPHSKRARRHTSTTMSLAQEVVPEIYLNDVTLAPTMPYPRADAEVTNFTDAGLFDRHSKELIAPAMPYRRGSRRERATNAAVTPSLPYNKPTVDTANWFAYQK